MFEGLRRRLGATTTERAGCGFLGRREIDSWIEGDPASELAARFEDHAGGCVACALLAADLGSFRHVLERGLLPAERRQFADGRATMHALFRREIEAMAQQRRSALTPVWKWAGGAAAAVLLLAVVAVPLLRDGATRPGIIGPLADGSRYEVEPMPFSAPLTVRGGVSVADLWEAAGSAYAAERWEEAAGAFAQVTAREPESADAHLYRGIALVMAGRVDEAVESLEEARRLDASQGLGGTAVHFYLGLAELDGGRDERAAESLRRAVATGGPFAETAADLLERLEDGQDSPR